ncbi:MAG TPA: hypothetical protein VF490_02295 [Chryseosolibacter sp.]
MRRLSYIFILPLLFACSKDGDPQKPDSIYGYWTVKTPDDLTRVTFRIGVDSDSHPVVESAAVQHNGSDYTSEPVDASLIPVSSTEIESITLRTTRFVIRFENLTANADFTEMDIAHSIFTIDSVIREFSPIKATRN